MSKVAVEQLILGVKVLGNAGHPASLKTLMKLLPGFGGVAPMPQYRLHVESVLALRNIAKKEPRMVRVHNQENPQDLVFKCADV